AQTPGSHLCQQRDQLDRGCSQAVDDLLLVAGIIAPRNQAGFLQSREATREDVGGDALLGVGQELPEMTAVTEHHVADDDQAPAGAQSFQRQIDRAARTWGIHAGAPKTSCNIRSVGLPFNWLQKAIGSVALEKSSV